MSEVKNIVEVLLFASSTPLNQKQINKILNEDFPIDLNKIVTELNTEYKELNKGFIIKKIGGGFQLLTIPKYKIFIERMFNRSRKTYLSKPSLEALAIIAYRQPVTKAEVESIRGVECGSVLNTLLDKELILVKGRSKAVGKPLLFRTTPFFLEFFGMEKISDLPKLKELSELDKNKTDINLFEIDLDEIK